MNGLRKLGEEIIAAGIVYRVTGHRNPADHMLDEVQPTHDVLEPVGILEADAGELRYFHGRRVVIRDWKI